MEWSRYQLGDVVSFEYGKPLPVRDRIESGSFDVVGSNGVDGKHAEALVQGPGVVVGRKGSAGKVCWYEHDFWPIDTTYFVTPKISVDMRWMYYLLRNMRLEAISSTTGVPGLNRNEAYKLEAFIPTPSEQLRIVEILDQAEDLRRLRTEADAKSERILQGLLMNTLGNPANWVSNSHCKPLEEFVLPLSGATPSKRINRYWSGTMPWVSPKDMKRDFLSDSQDHVSQVALDETSLNVVGKGNTLIVVRGMILARDIPVGINRRPVTINQDMKALIPKTEAITGAYVWAALRLAKQRLLTLVRTAGHGTRKLDTPDLMRFPIPSPDLERLRRVESTVEHHRLMFKLRQRSGKSISRLCTVALSKAFDGSLTSDWREAHIEELQQEMEHQAKSLAVG